MLLWTYLLIQLQPFYLFPPKKLCPFFQVFRQLWKRESYSVFLLTISTGFIPVFGHLGRYFQKATACLSPDVIKIPGLRFPQIGFHLTPHHLYRIIFRTIAWGIFYLYTFGLKQLPVKTVFVNIQVIHYYHIPTSGSWKQNLFHKLSEDLLVHCSRKNEAVCFTFICEIGKNGMGFPTAWRYPRTPLPFY